MTVDDVVALARAIVGVCAAPAACDIVRIERGPTSVTIHFVDGPVELDYWQNDFSSQVAIAKGQTVQLTRQVRARAMLEAAGTYDCPLWLLSGSRFVAEWLRWAGAGHELLQATRWADDLARWSQIPKDYDFGVHHAGRFMVYTGTNVTGEVRSHISLSDHPGCRFSERARPRLLIGTTLPETVVDTLREPERARTDRPLRLSAIVSHPFFETYDPAVLDLRNEDGNLVIAIDDQRTTFAPVPSAAMAIMPPDADPAYPWGVTAAERLRLHDLDPTKFRAGHGY